jgi:hypothetical protein
VSRRSQRFVTLPQIERLLNATSGPGGPCDVLDTPAMAARRDVVTAGFVRREQQRKSRQRDSQMSRCETCTRVVASCTIEVRPTRRELTVSAERPQSMLVGRVFDPPATKIPELAEETRVRFED